MNILSSTSKSNDFFYPFILGAFFILALVTMFFIQNPVFIAFFKESLQKKFYFAPEWFLVILSVLLCFVLGELLLNLGDIFISWEFSNKFFKVDDPSNYADSYISFFLKKSISNKSPMEIKTFAFEKVTENSKYLLTPDVFLFAEKSYQTELSDYYYYRSKLFAAIFLSIIFLFSFPIIVDIILSFKAQVQLTNYILNFLFFNLRIKKLYMIILILAWVLAVFFISKFILWLSPTKNYPIIIYGLKSFYIVLLFIPLVWIVPKIDMMPLANNDHFKVIQFYAYLFLLFLLITFIISYFLALKYRRYANLFLYLAYIKANQHTK